MVCALALCATATAAELPPPLVRLSEIDPSIRQDIRYATRYNFTGEIVPGYRSGECILARPAALALKRAQLALAAEGLSLKVFDCYRPRRAVAAFMRWSRLSAAANDKGPYHPRLTRRTLVAEGYIAARSMHSTGYAVDLTLVRLGGAAGTPASLESRSQMDCRRAGPAVALDEAPDLGTGFDCFDASSHHASAEVGTESRRWRRRLREIMSRSGFSAYEREWWHYVLRDRPRNAPSFDVDVTSSPR